MLIANQFNTANNTIAHLLADQADGAQLLKYNDLGFHSFTYDSIFAQQWTPNGDATLNPGEGAFYKSPIATTLTFVGEIVQGRLTNNLPIGRYALLSSMIPQVGTLSALGIPAEPGDILQVFDGSYSAYVYDGLCNTWLPNEPTIGVHQAFWYRKSPSAKTNLWLMESESVIRIADVGLGLNGGDLGFDVRGPLGLIFVIEASTNLLDWVPLQTNAAPTGSYLFTDPTAATLPTRFYRLHPP